MDLTEYKNNYKLITNEKESYYEIELANNNFCKVNIETIDKIKNVKIDEFNINCFPTWYKTKNGYIVCSISKYPSDTLYMHRYLMDQFHYDGKISVDHINQDKTDNCLENLRLATQSTQNHNQKKKERQFIKPPGFDIEFQLHQYLRQPSA